MALKMLTRMEDWAERGKKPTLNVQVPSATGEYLMNNKRGLIARIEEIHEIQIVLQIKPELMIPHYRIEREWVDNQQQRTEVLEDTSRGLKPSVEKRKVSPLKPVVGIPMPQHPAKKKPSILTWFMGLIEILTGQAAKKKRLEEERKEQQRQRKPRRPNNRNRQRNRNPKNANANAGENQASTSNKVETPSNKPIKAAEKDSDSTISNPQPAPSDESDGTQARRRRRRRRRPTAKREGQEDNETNTSQEAADKTPVSQTNDTPDVKKDVNDEESKPAKKRPPRRRRPNKPKQEATSATGTEKNKQKPVTPAPQKKPVVQEAKQQDKPVVQKLKQAEKKPDTVKQPTANQTTPKPKPQETPTSE